MCQQALMEARSKNSSKSLDFDALQPPSRGRQQKFTPPRKASQFISASPEECELEAESMTSQSSRTARTRLMERFREIGTKPMADNTPEQINIWIADYAKSEMARAGDFEELRPKSTDIGGFKQANERSLLPN